MMTTEEIVQQNLEAYNARDIESFLFSFSEDIKLSNFGSPELTASGKAEVKAIYGNLFQESPHLFSQIKNRMVFQNKVIDHELIQGRMGKTDMVEMILIYEVEDGKIFKITAIKK